MAFDAIITGERLDALLDPVSAVVDECRIRLDEEGVSITAVDPANVAMVRSELGAGGFESFEASDGLLGVPLERLDEIRGFANAGDLVHLELDAQTRKLGIRIDDLSWTMGLIDPETVREEPDIPDLSEHLTARVVVDTDPLNQGVKAADIVSDHIRFSANTDAEAFHISAEGDTDDVDLTLEGDDVIHAEVDDDATTLLSLSYIKDTTKPIPKETEVEVRFGEEYPLKLHYESANGQVAVENMIAPRVSSD